MYVCNGSAVVWVKQLYKLFQNSMKVLELFPFCLELAGSSNSPSSVPRVPGVLTWPHLFIHSSPITNASDVVHWAASHRKLLSSEERHRVRLVLWLPRKEDELQLLRPSSQWMQCVLCLLPWGLPHPHPFQNCLFTRSVRVATFLSICCVSGSLRGFLYHLQGCLPCAGLSAWLLGGESHSRDSTATWPDSVTEWRQEKGQVPDCRVI
jgi:hypothetical protein